MTHQDLILALGDCMLDLSLQVEGTAWRRKHSFAQAQVSPGGSAANFAVWAARLGAKVGLLARVGDDILGRVLLQDLQQEGVVSGVVVGKETTGLAVALMEQGDGPAAVGASHHLPTPVQPTMCVARGATSGLSVDDLDWTLLDRARLLHVTAYSFFAETTSRAALAAMDFVRKRGGLISLDPSLAGYLRGVGPEAFFALVDGADILFPNLDEGRVLSGEQEPERVLHKLLRRFPLVALKMGAAGAMAGTGGQTVQHPGFSVPVVDTMGAGDAFAAAFVASWLAHYDLAAALEEGNRIAAGVVQAAGARYAKAVPPLS